MVKWVDLDLEPAGDNSRWDLAGFIIELSEQPGRWAEVSRYPLVRMQSARSRGANVKKRYPGTEYAIRQDGDEIVLYIRVRKPDVEEED